MKNRDLVSKLVQFTYWVLAVLQITEILLDIVNQLPDRPPEMRDGRLQKLIGL